MRKTIQAIIKESIKHAGLGASYRAPLIGCASASDPAFAGLKDAVGKTHLLPADLLPGARSVAAFFLPFTRSVVDDNRHDPYVAREWAVAYVQTNQLIRDICQRVAEHFRREGIRVAYEQPTHNFDEQELVSFWSHKHVARICGLGQFGLHHMLITKRGCAGRLGSIVLDTPLDYADGPSEEYCRLHLGQECGYCVRSCPTGALTVSGLDKHTCYRRLLEVNGHYQNLGYCDVCGKCATGPCAVIE